MTDLSSTSALVLLWQENTVHTSPASQRYFGLLDLEPGRALLEDCKKVYPTYGSMIKNRKKMIMDIVLRDIKNKGMKQLVIFGSGLDALSIEAASREKNLRVYEADSEQMELKRRLIDEADAGLGRRIKCVTADILEYDALSRIEEAGWDPAKPTIAVFEGISYYIPGSILFGLVKKMRRDDHSNSLVLEYLLPQSETVPERARIPERMFGVLRKRIPGNMRITRYGEVQMKRRLESLGCRIHKQYTSDEMERRRLGYNRHYTAPGSGWIQICHASL